MKKNKIWIFIIVFFIIILYFVLRGPVINIINKDAVEKIVAENYPEYEIVDKNNESNKNNEQFDLIKKKRISTNYSILSGIQFIGEKNNFVITRSFQHLFLISCKYQEIVSIFCYYRMEIMHKGINNECYICLSDWISGHKIIRQININKEGDLIVEGNNYFEKFDFYNKNGLIDLGDTIAYIEDHNKE